jgi:uncharacterized protein DUF4145
MTFNWTCPYCNRPQSVTHLKYSTKKFAFEVHDTAYGPIGLEGEAIGCSNPECKQVEVKAKLISAQYQPGHGFWLNKDFRTHRYFKLIPESSAKPQPKYIPTPLREDYLESCLIKDLSPKASATLSRRCLQGMIRDFCGIKKKTLFEEIKELRKRLDEEKAPKGVSDDSVEAIDAVRKIGNIGAHMEKDINLIIDVEPEEAQLLIELIETLFDEWYIEREKRKARFANFGALAAAKNEQKKVSQNKPAQIEGPKPEGE